MNELLADVLEDWRHVLLSAMHDMKKHFRRKRIFLALLMAIAIPLLFGSIPKIAGVDYPENPEDYVKEILSFVSLFVVIMVAFFAGDTISGEFEKRTCFSIFATPQRRHSIFLGKHLSSLLMSMAMVTIFYLMIYVQVLAIYGTGGVSAEFPISYMLALLFTAGAVGMAVFFSSILSSGIQSTLVTFFLLFLILPIVSIVLMVAEREPWFLINYSADLIVNIYGAAPMEIPGFFSMTIPEYTRGVWVMAAYGMVLPFIGIFIASRREVK